MPEKLKVLDLFSGIGGFSLGLERTGGFETVAFCEIEEFPRKVLRKHWPDVPQFEDVRKLKASDVGPVDVICGGYPCQPFSHAGKRQGTEDDRHLWPEFNRLVDELRPDWVIGENVAGHISMGLDDVLSDLEGQGYTCRTFVIPACAVDAKHRRDRVWIVAHRERLRRGQSTAHSDAEGQSLCAAERQESAPWTRPSGEDVPDSARLQPGRQEQRAIGERTGQGGEPVAVANSTSVGCRQVEPSEQGRKVGERASRATDYGIMPRGWARWLPEPDVGRVANGVPDRVDRLKALGNAVVPQIPEMIGFAILEALDRERSE